MKWSTHYTGGALAGLAVCAGVGLPADGAAVLTTGAVAASIAPDVDAKLNFFGSDWDHRSFPHSLAFGGGGAVLLALIGYLWLSAHVPSTPLSELGLLSPGAVALLAPGAAVGYLSHLGLDALTRSGIWLVMPKGRRVGLPRKKAIRTGGLGELGLWAAMVISVLGLALVVFADALGGASFLLGR